MGIGNLTLNKGSLSFTGIALGTLAAIVLYHVMSALEKFRGEPADDNPLP
jgi:NCS2 family nucleobase:cation symporter-2